MKWNKFTGIIKQGTLTGSVELIEESETPTWLACVSDSTRGTQVSKNFKGLENAHEWCVSTLKYKNE
jgi:hypothetical protein